MKKLFLCLLSSLGLTACSQAAQKGNDTVKQEQEMTSADNGYETDTFATKNGHTVTFHALVHASIRVEYDGKEIQIDPAGKLEQRAIDYTAMPKADYIFVTHEHFDHFDKEAIATLTAEGTRLITNRRCADMLGYGEVMANGDSMALADDIRVEAVPAYNTTEGHTQFHPKGRDNGYAVLDDGLRTLHR